MPQYVLPKVLILLAPKYHFSQSSAPCPHNIPSGKELNSATTSYCVTEMSALGSFAGFLFSTCREWQLSGTQSQNLAQATRSAIGRPRRPLSWLFSRMLLCSECLQGAKCADAAVCSNDRFRHVTSAVHSSAGKLSLRHCDGVCPITRKNSRLKLDFVAKPALKDTSRIVL